MFDFLSREAAGLIQDFQHWRARISRKQQGLSDLLAARMTDGRQEVVGNLRLLAGLVVMWAFFYFVGTLIPVGYDWKCCYGPRQLPPFFMPWTYFVLDFVNPPALFALMILAIILRIRSYRGPIWSMALACLSLPVLWVLFKVDLEGVILMGLILLPIGVPLALLKPQLAAFALLANRRSMVAGVVWGLLSFVIWGFWPLTFMGIGSPEWHVAWPQDISLFPWGLIIALPLLWLSRGDSDMLMAAGSLGTPHLFPYHFAILMPALGRMSKPWALLAWALGWTPLLANYLGPAAWHFGNLLGLAIWLGLSRSRRAQHRAAGGQA